MNLNIQKPQLTDGKEIWKLIKRTGNLDLNSEYCYFMLSDLFKDYCAIVTSPDETDILGYVSCIPRQDDSQTLFVWQVCTDPRIQKRGMAKKLINFVIEQQSEKVEFIEATISDDNQGSIALFTSLAKSYGAEMKKENYIEASDFNDSHESEYIYKIGKLNY